MARKKIGGAVVPYSGKPIPTKGKLVHQPQTRKEGIDNLGGIANRGYAKNRFRHGLKNAYGRYRVSAAKFRAKGIKLGGRFFRYFTMFLVFLVLFAVVTDASYSSYKVAVNAIYSTTETVSDVVATGLDYVTDLIGFVDKFTPEPGIIYFASRECDLLIKIKGNWVEFKGLALYSYLCTEESKQDIINGTTLISYIDIVSTPKGYSKWNKVRLESFFGSQNNFVCRGGSFSTWGIRSCKYVFTSDFSFPD